MGLLKYLFFVIIACFQTKAVKNVNDFIPLPIHWQSFLHRCHHDYDPWEGQVEKKPFLANNKQDRILSFKPDAKREGGAIETNSDGHDERRRNSEY